MSISLRTMAALVVAVFWATVSDAWAEATIDFNRDIRPILSNKCFTCHGPDEERREAGLRLDDASSATHELESGARAIVPGKPDASELIVRVTSTDEALRMPPAEHGQSLTPREISSLRLWIEQGARFARHWSYERPVKVAPLAAPVEWEPWPRNEIDLFALQAMRQRGLDPSPEADRYALARRVFLDLTGLPPTIEEAEAFVNDADPQAYEKLVDDLLRRPSYGEHWARMWLDLARYADSAGYADDPPRTIWAYRDWVIQAINANMPFDQFTIEQVAGDMLPNATDDQLIATAFHRNTMTNNEGGTQDEEFRHAAIVDRVNTTMAVWMGTTMTCAQCHNHKYDPISQREYFGVFALFNNTADADRQDESPVLGIYSEEQRRRRWQEVDGPLAVLQLAFVAPASALRIHPMFWQRDGGAYASLQPATSVPILRELPSGAERETRIANRGNYLDRGPVVEPGFPAAFHARVGAGPANRLELARWLVSRENPRTARVIVNRYWEALFGRGIVATSEEFGIQGELPTHPELLDWLAVEFMESGWDSRAILRLIVTSAVYRQSSKFEESAGAIDPDNRWLARGPRVRLSAEMVRDQAMAAGGLLSKKMHGPPVRPPQPNLGLTAAFGGSTDWATSEGEDRFRRAIYTTWRRSNPYPSMTTFDAPNREVCTLRRTATNTPLQALVTLNDPVFVEASQSLARRAIEHSKRVEERVALAFRRVLIRPPSGNEVQLLVDLYHESHAHLSARPEAALELATKPAGELPPGVDAVDAGSMMAVCNVLLNLDEVFLKR